MTPLAITTFFIPAKFWLCGLVLLLPWHSDHLLLSKNNNYILFAQFVDQTNLLGDLQVIIAIVKKRLVIGGHIYAGEPELKDWHSHDVPRGLCTTVTLAWREIGPARPAGDRRPQHQLLSAEEFHVIMIRYFQNRKSDFLWRKLISSINAVLMNLSFQFNFNKLIFLMEIL